MADEDERSMTLGELAAAVSFIARERGQDLPAVLWAILRSEDLCSLIDVREPEPTAYAELASLDPAVYSVLTASPAGRTVLRDGTAISHPELRRRLRHMMGKTNTGDREASLRNLRDFLHAAGLRPPDDAA